MYSDQGDGSNYDYTNPDFYSPTTSKSDIKKLSPYLNFDPGYLPPTQPEFIFLDESSRQRGRMELAFSQIGGACMAGAGVGGVAGFFNGLKSTTMLGQSGALRRTQMLNYIMKSGAARANTLGTIAVMYSSFGVILSFVRGSDDELNTIAAGTATGLLYKSTAGLRKCGIGGLVGLSLSVAFCVVTSRDKLASMMNRPL